MGKFTCKDVSLLSNKKASKLDKNEDVTLPFDTQTYDAQIKATQTCDIQISDTQTCNSEIYNTQTHDIQTYGTKHL